MTRVFLLSPAYAGGQRARLIMSERAQFDLARRLRSEQPPTLGEVFAFSKRLLFSRQACLRECVHATAAKKIGGPGHHAHARAGPGRRVDRIG